MAEHNAERNKQKWQAFYEIIVQFGDSITAPCGSEVGRIAEKMLDEYVRSFREVVFEGKHSAVFSPSQAAEGVKRYPSINQNNYRNIGTLIQNEEENLRNAEAALAQAQKDLKVADELLTVAERVMGGTFVQSLVHEERQRREAKWIPNGLKDAGRRM